MTFGTRLNIAFVRSKLKRNYIKASKGEETLKTWLDVVFIENE